ncbi:MAG: lipopolysaccharide heptosyltransferase II [Acidobacteria bacterium]|nr:lipopolysaccharide heptosyltransferase II [Acidobacteriota bacterium]
MGTLKQRNIRRVIVRGTNWVGDAVMTVPALRELRRSLPGAHITLATRPWAKELFADAGFLDDLLIYDRPRPWSAVRQSVAWRRGNFDLAVLFPNAFEAALIPALARVPFRIGYATDGRSRLLTNPLPVPEWRSSKHEVFYYLNIVAELERALVGTKQIKDGPPNPSLHISELRQSEALHLLRAHGLREGRALVALCPGSINSRAKRWPAERYGALADSLINELNAEVLLIGSADELEVSQEVSLRMRNKPIVMTGKTSLSQVAGVLSLVDLLVTNDTGPAHIASALGRPTLVIFASARFTKLHCRSLSSFVLASCGFMDPSNSGWQYAAGSFHRSRWNDFGRGWIHQSPFALSSLSLFRCRGQTPKRQWLAGNRGY